MRIHTQNEINKINNTLVYFAERVPENTVYICGSSNGKRYHLTENCRGLSNCRAKTIKTTLEKAKKQGKTLCGWKD